MGHRGEATTETILAISARLPRFQQRNAARRAGDRSGPRDLRAAAAAAITAWVALGVAAVVAAGGARALTSDQWDFKTGGAGARVEWGDGPGAPVTLFVLQDAAGQAYLVSREAFSGDFNAEVDVYVPSFTVVKGSVVRVMLAAARPEDGFARKAFLSVREVRFTGAEPVDTIGGWKLESGKYTFLPRQPVSSGENFFKLRIERKGGTVKTYQYLVVPNPTGAPVAPGAANPGGWALVARFEDAGAEPLHLMLALSNTAGSESTFFPDARVSWSGLAVAVAGSDKVAPGEPPSFPVPPWIQGPAPTPLPLPPPGTSPPVPPGP